MPPFCGPHRLRLLGSVPFMVALACAQVVFGPQGSFAQDAPANAAAPTKDDPVADLVAKLPPEYRKAVEEFDLDKYIASLNPPTIEQILKDLEPIPTLEQVIDMVERPEKLPKRPELTEEINEKLNASSRKIAQTRTNDIGEAIRLKSEEVSIREEFQGPNCGWMDHRGSNSAVWHELVTARLQLEYFRLQQKYDESAIAASSILAGIDALTQSAHDRGRFGDAVHFAEVGLAIRRRLFDSDHLDTATDLNDLAGILKELGDYDRAELLSRTALSNYRRIIPECHPHFAIGLNTLAILAHNRGRNAIAQSLHLASVRIRLSLFGLEHPYTAAALNQLATVLTGGGNRGHRVVLARKSLELRKNFYSADHPDIANSMANFALILLEEGDSTGAEPLLRDALAMFQRLYSTDHGDIATVQANLASTLQDRGQLEEAETLFRDALAMKGRLYPPSHPDIAVSISNLAGLHQMRAKYVEAASQLREALTIIKGLGDHPYVATVTHNLANVLVEMGDLGEAEVMARQSLDMKRRLYSKDSEHVAGGLHLLAILLMNRGDLPAAEEYARQAVHASIQSAGGDNGKSVTCQYTLALILGMSRKTKELETQCRQLLSLATRVHNHDHPDVARAYRIMAGVLTLQRI